MKGRKRFQKEMPRGLPEHLYGRWENLFRRLPVWIFISPPLRLPDPPQIAPGSAPSKEQQFALDLYSETLSRRKSFHEETSRVVKRVFLTLLGTCLFCIITLAGSPDIQLITPDAVVTLPLLNYDIGFEAFLLVGPAVLIALVLYLHIFVGQQRCFELPVEHRAAILPNFSSWSARLTATSIFYWLVPFTLAAFAWKAWPRPDGPLLGALTVLVTSSLVFLQIRRCPSESRPWAVPLFLASLITFSAGCFVLIEKRQLNLFKANLAEKDLRNTNLAGAYAAEADLHGANLNGADLSGADLSGADLSAAKLGGTNLSGADLQYANMRGALGIVSNMSGADLRGANLNEAELNMVNFDRANLSRAKLSGVDLTGSRLTGVNLSGADLRGALVDQSQIDQACGSTSTELDDGKTIPICGNTPH